MTSIHEQLVHDTAQQYGVPDAVAAELLARSRPCVHLLQFDELSPAQRETARPAARTGGLPSFPDDADWSASGRSSAPPRASKFPRPSESS
ncbi:hypothetical protein ACFU9Y_03115 [Streptomyces sp. NPDC057621]|uniref:hypothetical protein n=1 Tax=Streptomyces sp. NPDC057621 TaxID=3346186 RepID=UPI003690D7C2